MRLALLLIALCGTACFQVALAGHKCNDAHPCVDGFLCVDERCVATGEGEGEGGVGEGEGEGAEGEGEGAEGEGAEGEGEGGEGEGGEGEGEGAGEGEGEGAVGEGEGEGEGGVGEGEGEGPGSVCGNGVVESGEGCDDGNTASSDGCSSTCDVENGRACFGQPSVCCTTQNVFAVPSAFASLDAAQTAAPLVGGGCIFVSAGSYGRLSVNRDITIVGEGAVNIVSSSGGNGAIDAGSRRVKVQGVSLSNTGGGDVVTINGDDGSLTLNGDDIGPGARRCINASGDNASITVTRSRIHGCGGEGGTSPILVGTSANRCTFDSDFVVENGSAVAGPTIDLHVDCNVTNLTVAGNVVATTASAAGITCSLGTTTNVTRSIIFGNSGVTNELGASCGASLDDFEGANGGGNIALDPQLVGGGDFHLRTTSPCIDLATPSLGTLDFDLQRRPLGVGDDLGADEVR